MSPASELFSRSRNSVAAWWSVRAPVGDLQVARVQSTLCVDMIVRGSEGLGCLPGPVVLDSGAGFEPAQARLPEVLVRMPLGQDAPTVELADGRWRRLSDPQTTALQQIVHPPWGPVVPNPECYACMSGCDPVMIVGRVTLDKLTLDLNSQMLQLARARREGPVASFENPRCSSR